jgi:hypothetical protein
MYMYAYVCIYTHIAALYVGPYILSVLHTPYYEFVCSNNGACTNSTSSAYAALALLTLGPVGTISTMDLV